MTQLLPGKLMVPCSFSKKANKCFTPEMIINNTRVVDCYFAQTVLEPSTVGVAVDIIVAEYPQWVRLKQVTGTIINDSPTSIDAEDSYTVVLSYNKEGESQQLYAIRSTVGSSDVFEPCASVIWHHSGCVGPTNYRSTVIIPEDVSHITNACCPCDKFMSEYNDAFPIIKLSKGDRIRLHSVTNRAHKAKLKVNTRWDILRS